MISRVQQTWPDEMMTGGLIIDLIDVVEKAEKREMQMKTVKMETEADLQAWLKSLPEEESTLIKSIFTGLTLEHARRRFPAETKAAVRRSKFATLRLLDKAKDDNELLIGLYSIRDFGNLDMLRCHRLNPV